jgi:hypothetical protein
MSGRAVAGARVAGAWVADARWVGPRWRGEGMEGLGDGALGCGSCAVVCIGEWEVRAMVGGRGRGYERPVTVGWNTRRSEELRGGGRSSVQILEGPLTNWWIGADGGLTGLESAWCNTPFAGIRNC